jgi:uncharacterized sodium:solute symporter family permease YidK
MLAGLAACVGFLLHAMDLSVMDSLARMEAAGLARVFDFDADSPGYLWKQVVAGAFITIAMTGMDQEMMQKNISVKTLGGAQKNMVLLTCILVVVLGLFLFLGGLLHLYAPQAGVTATGDRLFPAIVMEHMPAAMQLIFFVALVSALFPSADGAITALTSSFCIDLLGMQRRRLDERESVRWRHRVHLGFCALFLLLVMVFKWIDSASMIGVILKLAGYTYGPLLGLFGFGLLTRRAVRDSRVPAVVVAGPVLCALLEHWQYLFFGTYRLGLELLVVNGLFVFAGLWLVSSPGRECPRTGTN